MTPLRTMLTLGSLMVACAQSPDRSLDAAPLDGGLDAAPVEDGGLDADAAPAYDGAADGASCAEEDASSTGCRYVSSDGTAIIASIEPAPTTMNRCERDPVLVRFDFEPDDPASRLCAKDDQIPAMDRWLFTIGDGKAPPKSCIDGASIAVGSRLRVRRRDITSGACTPVLFVLDRPLVDSCEAQCFLSSSD